MKDDAMSQIHGKEIHIYKEQIIRMFIINTRDGNIAIYPDEQ